MPRCRESESERARERVEREQPQQLVPRVALLRWRCQLVMAMSTARCTTQGTSWRISASHATAACSEECGTGVPQHSVWRSRVPAARPANHWKSTTFQGTTSKYTHTHTHTQRETQRDTQKQPARHHRLRPRRRPSSRALCAAASHAPWLGLSRHRARAAAALHAPWLPLRCRTGTRQRAESTS
jgi:hypothetical protein